MSEILDALDQLLKRARTALGKEDAAKLTTKERKKLKKSTFCGPGKSFPVNDCAHYTAALRMLSRSKFSDSTKKNIHACITRRGKTMGCIKKEKSDIGLTEAEINDIISLEIFNETRALVEQSIKNPGLELVLAKKCV